MERAERRQSAGLNTFGPGAQALFHTCLGLFALLCIVPFLFVIIISFTSEDSIRQIGYSFAPLSWSTQAYGYVFRLGGALWRSYFNSFLITVIGTTLSVADWLSCFAMGSPPLSQNSELSASILRTMLLVITMHAQPTTLCSRPAAALMPMLWVLA